MTPAAILAHRLQAQRLTGSKFASVSQAVAGLGAVQSQDFVAAKWALAARTDNASDAVIQDAFDHGQILRTHVMRPTWHFITPADIGWMIKLTGPRMLARGVSQWRRLGLSSTTFNRSKAALLSALRGGNYLTRAQCEQLFAAAGISLVGPSNLGAVSSHLMMEAELSGLITSGPMCGKQHTYALMAERAPQAVELSRERALAELARRYFASHGPATVSDFAWWSGLTMADAQRGIDSAKSSLTSTTFGKNTYWFGADQTATSSADAVYLLPNYDEYIIAYTDRSLLLPAALPTHKLDARANPIFNHALIVDGRVMGTWRRILTSKTVSIEITPFGTLSQTTIRAATAAAYRYGLWLELSPSVVFK